ncbi:MAG: DUF4962 domain-containing protein [Planctomycetota bacterium]
MKSQRHPHPHVDPRQPRNGTRPGTNPPVFAWRPPDGAGEFALTVARDAELSDAVICEKALTEPAFLPTKALAPGKYYWKWSAGDVAGELFEFEIAPDAVLLEVPPVEEWLAKFPAGHPRIWISPEEVEELRASRTGARAEMWKRLEAAADKLVEGEHEIEEPPFLGDWDADYEGVFASWYKTMHESRRFIREALTMALAYVASGDEKYARPACRRMASISGWDPTGSSHIAHNDEAHMSLLWDGTQVIDFVWDQFTAEEKKTVVEQYRRRGEINFEYMHGRGSYGVTRFDSHAGREIVFLAQLAFVFHEEIPEAKRWLRWLRPVLCGIWPIWAGDDGAWSEGPSYGLAYVRIMTFFASALKKGAGIDLYRRPFWKGHAEWRRWCFPPYVEWMGFGDHSERWSGTWRNNAGLVELIARETGSEAGFADYVADFRAGAEESPARFGAGGEGGPGAPAAQKYFAGDAAVGAAREDPGRVLTVFEGAGWAAVRTDLFNAEKDVAFIFRSSRYGAFSHSHSDNNDFIVHVGGRTMAMPSGYYDGYGSNHHTHWVWHTGSHNCLTLSGAAQLMRTRNSGGEIRNAFEDDALAYMVGVADASYSHLAERCRRHVVYLKESGCFLLVDELVNRKEVNVAPEWNIHSWAEFDVDEKGRSFTLKREGSELRGHFLYHHNAFFTLTDGWDPPMQTIRASEQWRNQHHLRFTTAGFAPGRNLGVVLAPRAAGISSAEVSTERVGDAEVARIGADLAAVNMGEGIDVDGLKSGALVALRAGGRVYEIGDAGVRAGS